MFWYGGRLLAAGEISAGSLTSFLIYTLIVAFALGGLADLWADFMRAAGAAERVFELLDRVPTIPPRGGLRLTRVTGRVALEGIDFSYPSRPDVPVLTDAVEPDASVTSAASPGHGELC